MTNTVSLEVAKKLKEAGWEQKHTHYAWVFESLSHEDLTEPPEPRWMITSPFCPDDMGGEWTHAAPTIGELLEALPHPHDRTGHKNLKLYRADDETYEAYYSDIGGDTWENCIASHAHPADALAILWLKLREKKLV